MSDTTPDPLFVEFLRQGPGADLDAFCRAQPAHAARLRELHAEHERALARLRAAGVTSVPASLASASSLLDSSSAASSELFRRIVAQGPKGARYRLRGEIARGGMGAILKVWDEDFGRELAMKVVLGSDGQRASHATPPVDGRVVARFLEEAQITGQLDHPCVVPVHELGLDNEGQVYFTMRLVHGRDLGHILHLVRTGAEGWTRTRALGVLLRVCEAMAYAHSKGVVHRDLKPANVMVGSFGEVYVMDWGLARVLGRPDAHDLRLRQEVDAGAARSANAVRTARHEARDDGSESSLVTMEGDVLGTPAYMPIEQARGKIEEISQRSDVYAIGAMLYHLLAGDAPYSKPGVRQTGREVLSAVLAGPPQPIRELASELPAELEAICEKAMAREASARYSDTLDLAEDLRAFLEGRVVRAYQTGAVVELKKWVARNKPLAAAGVTAIVFLVAGLGGSLWQKGIADENAALASVEAAEATRQKNIAREQQALAETREQDAASAARRAEAVGRFLSGMLRSANPLAYATRDVPVSSVVDVATRRLDEGEFAADPRTEFALRTTLGDTYQGVGKYDESERQYRVALDLLPKLPGDDPQRVIRFELDFADLLVARGKFDEAGTRIASLRAMIERAGLSRSEAEARALGHLAAVRYNQGATGEAIELSRQAIEIARELAPEDSLDHARMGLKLAFYLEQNGELDASLAEVERALVQLESGDTLARFEAASALRRRASIRSTMRDLKASLADLEEALRIREAVCEPDSPHVADLVHDIASTKSQLGLAAEAEVDARRALQLRRRALGDHRDTATALTTLGAVLAGTGRRTEARAAFEEALAMRRKVLPDATAAIGDSIRRLGSLARDEGDLATAETLYTEALENWRAELATDHPDVADVMFDLARVKRLRGDAAGARPLAEEVVRIRIAKFGIANGNTLAARDELASVLLDVKDWTAAETLLREAVALYEQKLRPGHPVIAYTGAQVGAALLGQGRVDEAEPLLLAGWAAIGEDPKFWAVNKLFLLDHLVLLYEARGDEERAATYRAKAAALRK